MRNTRRHFLFSSGAAALACAAAPLRVFANWPKDVFGLSETRRTLDALLGGQTAADTGVTLTTPAIAENGAQVRVAVKTELEEVEMISLLVEKNPVPLTSQFVFSPRSRPSVEVNLKVRETSKVIALVKADGKFYRAESEVRVTAGGCG